MVLYGSRFVSAAAEAADCWMGLKIVAAFMACATIAPAPRIS